MQCIMLSNVTCNPMKTGQSVSPQLAGSFLINTPGTAGGPGGRDRTLAVKSRKKRRKINNKSWKVGDNNGQATHGARKHAWRTQAAWAKRENERLNDGNNNDQLRIATPPRVAHAKPPGPKYWGKHGRFPEVGQKQKNERREKKTESW